jgi:hypothetical protein
MVGRATQQEQQQRTPHILIELMSIKRKDAFDPVSERV